MQITINRNTGNSIRVYSMRWLAGRDLIIGPLVNLQEPVTLGIVEPEDFATHDAVAFRERCQHSCSSKWTRRRNQRSLAQQKRERGCRGEGEHELFPSTTWRGVAALSLAEKSTCPLELCSREIFFSVRVACARRPLCAGEAFLRCARGNARRRAMIARTYHSLSTTKFSNCRRSVGVQLYSYIGKVSYTFGHDASEISISHVAFGFSFVLSRQLL